MIVFIFSIFLSTNTEKGIAEEVVKPPVSLTLADSVQRAIHHNYDVKYYKAAREKSYWALQESKANKKVSVSYNYTGERYKPTTSNMYTNYFDNEMEAAITLYSGGKLEAEVEEAKQTLNSADLDITAARQQLKGTVTGDYFSVLKYKNELTIATDTMKNYQDHLTFVQAEFTQGLVAKTDVLSSQVDLANEQDTFVQTKNSYINAIATLNNDIGLDHDTSLILKDNFGYVPYSVSLEECLQYALQHRPELAQYEAKKKGAAAEIDIAKSGKLPIVKLGVGQDWHDYQKILGFNNGNWFIELTASFTLFDSGIVNSEIRQAQYNLDMVINQTNAERDTVLLEVREYYLNMKEAEQQIKTDQVTIDQAKENLSIAKVRYSVGVGTNLDVLDDILLLNTAQKNYAEALYNYNNYKAKLEEAMGVPVI
jgi:outer membrane protein